MQETFVIACQHVDRLKSSPNPQGWLINTLKNTTRKIQETRNIHSRYAVMDNSIWDFVADPSADQENPGLFYDGMISKEDYYLLSRSGIDGCSVLELANELGINVATCRKRMQRARERFRKQYGREIAKVEKRERK